MNITSRFLPLQSLTSFNPMLWWGMLVIVAMSLAMRIYFYTGFFGSDEVTYLQASVKILHGDWSPSNYIGAIRYGFQLPIAGFMYLFGQNETAANVWTLLCSLAEIGIVVIIGNFLLGFRAAMFAGLILCFLPLHVHYAGRMMADPPLALFITTSFLLFWLAQHKDRAPLFFMAGISAGFVFWIKESTTIYLVIFLTYPLLFRCWHWKWAWIVTGFALMICANLLFLWLISGDPLYVYHTAASAVAKYVDGDSSFSTAIDAPLYYFKYLFINVYHTSMLGYFAIGALYFWWRNSALNTSNSSALSFVVWWSFGMILLFSLMPVSLYPFKLITKQVNYMLMFMAPLALLSGHFLAQIEGKKIGVALLLILVPGVVLSALEKNNVAVFTANTKAAVLMARDKPEAKIYGSSNAHRSAPFYTVLRPDLPPVQIGLISTLLKNPEVGDKSSPVYAIVDTQTRVWLNNGIDEPDKALACFVPDGILKPINDLALPSLFKFVKSTSLQFLPSNLGEKLSAKIDDTTVVKPAYIFVNLTGKCNK